MKKKELEQARRDFTGGLSATQLRSAVQADLEVVKDAYDLTQQFLTKIEMMLANVDHDDKPYKAMKELAGALKDTASVMIAAREEARASVAHASQAGAAAPPAVGIDVAQPAGALPLPLPTR